MPWKTSRTGVFATLDLGLPLPVHHSSVWLRSSAGYSPGDRQEPFAKFFFGGFGNNGVDHQDEKRYRDYASFPGTELDAVHGTNFSKALLEWNLPPVHFRHVGIPSFYLSWLRPAVFSSAIVTNMDDGTIRRTLTDVGAQADLRFSMLSRLSMTLSTGYAIAFEKDARRTDELMVSLKVM